MAKSTNAETAFGQSSCRQLFFILAASALLILLPHVACGQAREFAFDANGNLLLQSAENIAAPEILAQPQPQVVAPGALASFFVVAGNTHNLTYQWRFNGANISGATADTLLLTNVGATNEGQYSVVLVNSSGSVTSAPAALMLDGDGDGLPDSWELANFSNLNQYPTGDFDGDGVSNLDEFLDGTNPADSASLLFRLTVLSDGGQVVVNPSRFSFTNGEMVTLSASATAPNTFHGWTGDTNTTSNPITLTMTNNKTVFAHLGTYDMTWTNTASGNWNVAANWSPNFVPGTNDNVIISRGVTVTLNSDTACGSLILSSSPTLTGSGVLTVKRDSSWANGTMSGSGRTIIQPGAALHIGNTVTLGGSRTLENGGTVLWTGGNLAIGSAASITNRVGALFEVRHAADFNYTSTTGSRFDNAGTFRKTVNAGATRVFPGMTFNNHNVVELQTGTFTLFSDGTHSGTFDVPIGTALNLMGGTHTANNGSSITGAGSLIFSGATATLAGLVNVTGTNTVSGGTANLTGNFICTNNTLVISSGTANFSGTSTVTPTVVNQSGGTMGGNRVVTVLGQMNWTGGTMSGSGRTIIPPGAALHIGNTVTLGGSRTLENGGTVLWTGGNIAMGSATSITNRVGALFEVRNSADFNYTSTTGSRFDNAGTFRKSVNAGATRVFPGMTFNNHNLVELQTGTFTLFGNGTHSGTFEVPTGTTLNLVGGTHTASSGSSITGAGNLIFGGATASLAGWVNVTGTNTFSGGTANLTGNYICTNNTLVISSGTANFSGTGTVTPSVVNQSGGTMGGNQMVTVLSQMNWTGGTMSGSGRTLIPPGVALNIGNTVTLGGSRTLENGGTVLWTGGNFATGSAVVITNQPGALFEVRHAADLNYTSLTGSRFDNAGTFRKTSSTGATRVFGGMTFNNHNLVELQTGTFTLFGNGTHSGTFEVPTGTTLNLMGGTHTASSGSSITGAGSLIFGGATATLAGLVNVSGTNTIIGGTANLTGNYICTNNTLVISSGTANFSGTGTVTPTVVNQSGGTMGGNQMVTVLSQMNWTGGTMSGSGRTLIPPGVALNIGNTVTLGGSRTLENGGTVLWTGGNFATGSAVVITNRAGALFEVRNAAGLNYTSLIGSRFDNAGTFRKSVSTGTTTVFGGMTFNNYNVVDIRSGILVANGGYTSTASSLLNCALSGTTAGTGYGRLQVSGAVTLNGALGVALTNGFVPTTNDAFTVLTAGTRNGAFANFYYPSNEVSMQMSNTVNSVIVRVTEGLAVSRPVLLTPEVIGSDLKLTWTASSNQTYRLEFSPNLSSINWLGLAGDVIATSNTASKLDPLTSSNRLYRVRVLP